MAAIKNKVNFLDDFGVGHVFHLEVGKTLTEGVFNAFAAFDKTTTPLNQKKRPAERDGVRGLVAPPGLVMHIVFSQSGRDCDDGAPRGTHRNRMGNR